MNALRRANVVSCFLAVTFILSCFLTVTFILLTSQGKATTYACGATSPRSCKNVDLWLSSGGKKTLRDFLKGMPQARGGKSARAELLRVLIGPPANRIDLSGGSRLLFSACQIHNCDDKGALITDINGNILAAGVVHHEQDAKPALTVYARNKSLRAEMQAVMMDWAQKEIDAQAEISGHSKRVIENVDFEFPKS